MKSMIRLAVLTTAVTLLAACGKGDAKSAHNAQAQMPPQEVGVVKARRQSVPVTRDLVGRLASTRIAQVRARVAGIILKRVYTEGTDVKKGQVLFQIDPAPLKATLHAQQAALAKAQADATNAALTAKRYARLRKKDLISQQDLDSAEAAARTTASAVKQAEANVESARLDLGYATVTAPISGRAGRALVTEGALVGQGEATELTTIEQIDPIYVNFSQSVSEVGRLQQAAGPGGRAAKAKFKVEVLMPDGSVYPHPGTLDFSDLAVDPGTGAMSLRAVMANPDHRLLPGMFVNLHLTTGHLDNAFLLPQAAVQRDDKGAYVMVVDDSGKVQERRVDTHGMTQTSWIVTGPLDDNAQVIVAGLQKIKPGAPAKAVPAAAADQAAAAPAGGAS